MSKKFSRQFINPMKAVAIAMGIGKGGAEVCIDRITYNPELTKRNGAQYERRLQQSHDGTMHFTYQMLMDLMTPLIEQRSCPKEHENRKDIVSIRYEVGDIRLATTYHIDDGVDLPIGHYPGQREKASMPVKCIITLKNGKELV